MSSRLVLTTLILCLFPRCEFAQSSATGQSAPSPSVKQYGAVGDGVADDSLAIQKAINDTANPVVYFPGGTYRLGRGLTMQRPQVKLSLAPSAILVKNSNTNMLRVTADDVSIEGGVFDGRQENGFTGMGITVQNCRGFSMSAATVKNQAGAGIYLNDASDFHIISNKVLGDGAGIFGDSNTNHGSIEDNFVDTSNTRHNSHDIAFHSTLPQKRISDITIARNHMTNGAVFCVEVGAFGGLRPTNINVGPGNTCEAAKKVFGGYSFDEVDGGTIFGNSFDAKGRPSVMAIELGMSTNIQVSENDIKGGGTLRGGINVTGSHDCILKKNVMSELLVGGINLYAASDRPSASDNRIEENEIEFRSVAHAIGIRLVSNRVSNVDRNIILKNKFESQPGNGNTAVQLQCMGPCSLDGTVITQNSITGFDIGLDEKQSTHTKIAANEGTFLRK